ncbi:sphingomyelin phosphodiesterase [Pedobacter cryoconitis]|uniref:sphingomyelin phosphodiesterase n=1 Tax=Pedobacter cryoconitis TaxID=188932 RepID=UPI001622724E|nr:sphingomyelin phosphodiesterase [Pedobacter cryoconitis]MBB6273918.1 sphingomyelin phosphodiesterase [Pedobacter cryoconitis]
MKLQLTLIRKTIGQTRLLIILAVLLSGTSCRKENMLTENSSLNASLNNNQFSSGSDDPPAIKVLTHNLFLLPDVVVASTTQWSQAKRGAIIGSADYLKDYDVLLLQECFDNSASKVLKDNLASEFPYQTPVLGRSKAGWDKTSGTWRDLLQGAGTSGGVMIASKWPIEKMMQHIYPAGCHADAFSLKGFVYAVIIKDGKRVHFVASHTQSTQPSCEGRDVIIRKTQFEMMKSYVDSLNIPKTELVIFGGDFNVIKGTSEYTEMLKYLNVGEPDYSGVLYTWDTKTNSMASYHYPYPANKREYIDYIFVSKDHFYPSKWQNLAFDPVSSSLMIYTNLLRERRYWTDYSDHYPVAAFINADEEVPASSMKYRKYDHVSFQSVKTGKFINYNLSKPNDWLTVNGITSKDLSVHFNLVNIDRPDKYNEIVNGKIRVELSERLNNFWYWNILNGGDYYYFPKNGVSLKSLELEIVKKANGNSEILEDGDTIVFKDYNSYNFNKRYYLQVNSVNGTDKIYLNGTSIGDSEKFIVKLNTDAPLNWTNQLIG